MLLGEALEYAKPVVGSRIDGYKSILSELTHDEEGEFVSIKITWEDDDSAVLCVATVLADGSVEEQ